MSLFFKTTIAINYSSSFLKFIRIFGGAKNPRLSGNPHGKITQMYFWAREMSANEMLQFTGSCNHSLDKTGNFVLSNHYVKLLRKYLL